jgi:hypothetical protein
MLRVLIQLLAIVQLVNRYLSATFRASGRGRGDETVDDYEPTLTVVIPVFNEADAIQDTLRSVLASDYPREKLRVVCFDDGSSDDSWQRARAVAAEDDRLSVVRSPVNVGKRLAINRVVREVDSELIVSVDSDVLVEPGAIRQLVRRFARPSIAAVGGWVDVRNKHDNWITRMQVLKYWYAYFVAKNLEKSFHHVMAVSACLAAYRRSVLLELMPILEERAVLGVPIKYGEDRFLTRQIVKAGYHTTSTLEARCRTFVPATLAEYFNQQLRLQPRVEADPAGRHQLLRGRVGAGALSRRHVRRAGRRTAAAGGDGPRGLPRGLRPLLPVEGALLASTRTGQRPVLRPARGVHADQQRTHDRAGAVHARLEQLGDAPLSLVSKSDDSGRVVQCVRGAPTYQPRGPRLRALRRAAAGTFA